ARKKDVLASLEMRLSIQHRLLSDIHLSAAIAELERTKAQLSDYVGTINQRFGKIGRSVHDILWAEQRTRDEAKTLPGTLDDVALAGVRDMTRHDVDARKANVEVLARAYADIEAAGGPERHPWRGVGNLHIDFFGRERLIKLLGSVVDAGAD